MSIEYDDKGKIFTDVIRKTSTKAIIQTTTDLIEGNIHVRRDHRLIDELDNKDNFLAITDAVIYNEDKSVKRMARFLSVNRSHIIWVLPVEE